MTASQTIIACGSMTLIAAIPANVLPELGWRPTSTALVTISVVVLMLFPLVHWARKSR